MDPTTPAILARGLNDLQISLNIAWTLLCGFLVMFMQAGFALVESGLTRARNVAHTMGMNFFVYSLGMLAYWAIGFGLQMGGVGALPTFGQESALSGELGLQIGEHDWGLVGTSGFFLSPTVATPSVAALFLFQMMFMDTATTIPTGALAERWKFASFVIFSTVMAAVIYPIYANWVWGGGWLSALGRNYGLGHGHVDFAGSSVVHMTGGVCGFVGARMVGPRLDKYGPSGEPRALPGHNVPFAVIGTFVLAFGWFGFNAGSTLAATDARIAVVAVNTMLAAAAGACAATLYVWVRFGRPDVTWMCNGMLAGLVGITASCAFVSPPLAVFIGAIAGLLVVMAAVSIEGWLRVDDPVGACAVHGVGGAWGVIALGLFADGSYGDGYNGVSGPVRGLIFGDSGQFIAEIIGLVANVAFVSVLAICTFWVIGQVVGNRVAHQDEAEGLDIPEMGIEGYARDRVL